MNSSLILFVTLAKGGSVGCAGLSQHEAQKLRDHGGPDVLEYHQVFFKTNHLGKVDMLGVVKWDGDGLEQVDV